jgi:hypothetical protein
VAQILSLTNLLRGAFRDLMRRPPGNIASLDVLRSMAILLVFSTHFGNEFLAQTAASAFLLRRGLAADSQCGRTRSLATHPLDAADRGAEQRPPLAAWAAIPVALSYTVRPTNSLAILIFRAYVAVRHPAY